LEIYSLASGEFRPVRGTESAFDFFDWYTDSRSIIVSMGDGQARKIDAMTGLSTVLFDSRLHGVRSLQVRMATTCLEAGRGLRACPPKVAGQRR